MKEQQDKPVSKEKPNYKVEVISQFSEDGKAFEQLMEEIIKQIILK